MDIQGSRFDYFLIWGNGMQYTKEIIAMIEHEKSFEIEMILKKRIKSMKRFIKEVYSYDYAPFSHLKNKTRYLLTVPPEVVFIFIKNNDPQEEWMGEGEYRHLESTTVKCLKSRIRDIYNERKMDRRTENHVVHASDNELQTDHMLKCLGYELGIDTFRKKSLIGLPHHIKATRCMRIKKVALTKLYSGTIIDNEYRVVLLSDTPQYRGISDSIKKYEDYLDKYRGTFLCDYYSVEKYQFLLHNFQKTEYNKLKNLVVIKKDGEKYVILDGVHRASILLARNVEETYVLELMD